MKHILLLLSLSFLSHPLLAQNSEGQEKHPLDVALDKCIEKDSSTIGMSECMAVAYDSWDQELNRYYQLLREEMSSEQKEALKKAQLAWIDYRDRELENMATIYGSMDGTMYRLMYMGDKVELVKRRVMELKSYYDLLRQEY
jgi:uncharacterized protein YecT (DUF1311 family)